MNFPGESGRNEEEEGSSPAMVLEYCLFGVRVRARTRACVRTCVCVIPALEMVECDRTKLGVVSKVESSWNPERSLGAAPKCRVNVETLNQGCLGTSWEAPGCTCPHLSSRSLSVS